MEWLIEKAQLHYISALNCTLYSPESKLTPTQSLFTMRLLSCINAWPAVANGIPSYAPKMDFISHNQGGFIKNQYLIKKHV